MRTMLAVTMAAFAFQGCKSQKVIEVETEIAAAKARVTTLEKRRQELTAEMRKLQVERKTFSQQADEAALAKERLSAAGYVLRNEPIPEGVQLDEALRSKSPKLGALAASIATIGLYGVMSYTVARRRNEIGIRMALGAARSDVVRMVMREASLLLVAGVLVGTALAVVAARTAATLLFGLHPGDPATLAMAAGGLGLVAMLASYFPALRASRLQPTEALRED